MVYLRQREIVYFEMEDSSQRLLKIVTSQKEIYTYSRLGDFIRKLKGDWFIKIYRPIYVKRQHIQKFSEKE
ncbi:MAG: LytTR family transcriptional regulator DNA-binding domain-containing protein [Vagococcus salmoninarum]|uniref:LytTR family transcriptional regulator DNA-binding domain-containing protein n=1 Tax=Vagococcus salmoninarum TaxID=2739 RepID=UPI003F96522D